MSGRRGSRNQPPAGSRLMSLHQMSAYLAISYAAARELVIYGHVPSVRLPSPRAIDGRRMNRLLVDVADLDTFIEKHRYSEAQR